MRGALLATLLLLSLLAVTPAHAGSCIAVDEPTGAWEARPAVLVKPALGNERGVLEWKPDPDSLPYGQWYFTGIKDCPT